MREGILQETEEIEEGAGSFAHWASESQERT